MPLHYFTLNQQSLDTTKSKSRKSLQSKSITKDQSNIDFSSKTQKRIIVLFVLVFVFQVSFCLSVDVISPLMHSSKLSSHLVPITKNLIPEKYFSMTEFTIAFELTLIFNSQSNQDFFINFFIFGDDQNANSLSTQWNGSKMDFYRDPLPEKYQLADAQTHLSGSKAYHKFFFLVEVYPGTSIELILLHFEPSTPTDRVGQPKKVFWSSYSPSLLKSTLFTFDLAESSFASTEVRYLYAIDKIFSVSDEDTRSLYKGLANLQVAVYFYMEPAFSTVLVNRSRFNYKGGHVGSPRTSFESLESVFSLTKNRPLWFTDTFSSQFFTLHFDSMKTFTNTSHTVLVNFELYNQTLETAYLNNIISENAKHYFLLTFNPSGVSIFEAYFLVTNIDTSTNKIDFTLNVDYRMANLKSFTFSESYNSILPLKPRALKLTFFFKQSTRCIVSISVLRDEKPIIEEHISEINNITLADFGFLVLGASPMLPKVQYPTFILSFIDVQIFHGGAFFHGSNTNNFHLISFSKNHLENSFCLTNPYLSRYSKNPKLDALYTGVGDDCSLLVFNDSCTIVNCEICAQTECLVCQPYYVLENGGCAFVSENPLDYDVFSRNRTSTYKTFKINNKMVRIGFCFLIQIASFICFLLEKK